MAPHTKRSVVGPVRWGRDGTRRVVLSVIGIAAVLIVECSAERAFLMADESAPAPHLVFDPVTTTTTSPPMRRSSSTEFVDTTVSEGRVLDRHDGDVDRGQRLPARSRRRRLPRPLDRERRRPLARRVPRPHPRPLPPQPVPRRRPRSQRPRPPRSRRRPLRRRPSLVADDDSGADDDVRVPACPTFTCSRPHDNAKHEGTRTSSSARPIFGDEAWASARVVAVGFVAVLVAGFTVVAAGPAAASASASSLSVERPW